MKTLSIQRPRPSMLIATPADSRGLVKPSEVNWEPWSVLNIRGAPWRSSASSSASMQKEASSVFESLQESTRRLAQSMTAVRSVSYTHLRAHETRHDLVCRLLLE